MSPPEGQGIIEYDQGIGEPMWATGSGEITLETVPDAGRETVAGSFNAELTSNDTEGTVMITGEFDFAVPSYAFDEGLCTPEGQATAEAERAAEQAAAESRELPDVPADLEGMTVTVSDIENGFSAEDVPMQVLTTICAGDSLQWALQDDVTDAPIIRLSMSISPDTEPGTYSVASRPQEGRMTISLNVLEADTRDAVQFTVVPEGALRLDEVPSAAGEPFSGALSVTVTPNEMLSDVDASITVEGVFNLPTDDANFCES
jgi:hypothetical protein